MEEGKNERKTESKKERVPFLPPFCPPAFSYPASLTPLDIRPLLHLSILTGTTTTPTSTTSVVIVVNLRRSESECLDADDVNKAEFELIHVGPGAVDEMTEISETRALGGQHQVHATVAQMTEWRQAVGTQSASELRLGREGGEKRMENAVECR